MNPRAGTLPSFVVSKKREGGEGTPRGSAAPSLRSKARLLVPTQWQSPACAHPGVRAVGSTPGNGAPPWSPGGLGLTPALECRCVRR